MSKRALRTVPTVFHVTHWKAGSQWIQEVLRLAAPQRFVSWRIADPTAIHGGGLPGILLDPLIPGNIYGAVYLPRPVLERLATGLMMSLDGAPVIFPRRMLSNWWNYAIRQLPRRSFVVMRDLRDTLVSMYFSQRQTHDLMVEAMKERRRRLQALDEEQGLIYLLDEVLPPVADIQMSWIGTPDVWCLRFEDIIEHETVFFEQLMQFCQIRISRERLSQIVSANSFEALAGRPRGTHDPTAHLRMGIAGDWKSHFSPRLKQEFKSRYGALLVTMGYEKDLSW